MLMLYYIWYCGSANHLVVLNTARTRGHAKPENFCEVFKIKFEKIFLYKQLARVVQMWNKPPNEVVKAQQSVYSGKAGLDSHIGLK